MKQQEVPSKTYFYGNTKVVIVSPLVEMTPEEQKEWYDREWEKGNPVLKGIVDAVDACIATWK